MKQLILSLLILLQTITIGNEIHYFYLERGCYSYRTTGFAYKEAITIGESWGEWSEWMASNIPVTINLDDDVIIVYSKMRQTFRILRYVGEYPDDMGGEQYEWKAIDQDNDRCRIRFRVDINGKRQLYIEYANIKWVYNLKKK